MFLSARAWSARKEERGREEKGEGEGEGGEEDGGSGHVGAGPCASVAVYQARSIFEPLQHPTAGVQLFQRAVPERRPSTANRF